jgi:hypothetical protein
MTSLAGRDLRHTTEKGPIDAPSPIRADAATEAKG